MCFRYRMFRDLSISAFHFFRFGFQQLKYLSSVIKGPPPMSIFRRWKSLFLILHPNQRIQPKLFIPLLTSSIPPFLGHLSHYSSSKIVQTYTEPLSSFGRNRCCLRLVWKECLPCSK